MPNSTRLSYYDYSQQGAYFVTICCHNRLRLLGKVKDDHVCLSTVGAIASDCWAQIGEHFPCVIVDEFVIMPNHVHGVLLIDQQERGEQTGATERQTSSLSIAVRSYKSAVTRAARLALLPAQAMVWQAGFYEHVIRDQRDLDRVRMYIRNNPLQWHMDELNGV